LLRAQLRRLTIQIEPIHEQNIDGIDHTAHKGGAVLAKYLEPLIIPWNTKQLPQSHDIGVDFCHDDGRFGYFRAAILREGATAQTDHDNFLGRWLEEQKAHHRARIGNYQLIRRVTAHLTLGRHKIEVKRQGAVPPVYERLALQKPDGYVLELRKKQDQIAPAPAG
jgi:hypothetical protein